MGSSMMSEGWNALVDELKTLEAFFPLLGSPGEQDEVLEEIAELEDRDRVARERDVLMRREIDT